MEYREIKTANPQSSCWLSDDGLIANAELIWVSHRRRLPQLRAAFQTVWFYPRLPLTGSCSRKRSACWEEQNMIHPHICKFTVVGLQFCVRLQHRSEESWSEHTSLQDTRTDHTSCSSWKSLDCEAALSATFRKHKPPVHFLKRARVLTRKSCFHTSCGMWQLFLGKKTAPTQEVKRFVFTSVTAMISLELHESGDGTARAPPTETDTGWEEKYEYSMNIFSQQHGNISSVLCLFLYINSNRFYIIKPRFQKNVETCVKPQNVIAS